LKRTSLNSGSGRPLKAVPLVYIRRSSTHFPASCPNAFE